jgi:hypothetical protein
MVEHYAGVVLDQVEVLGLLMGHGTGAGEFFAYADRARWDIAALSQRTTSSGSSLR